MEGKPRARSVVDCREMTPGHTREEITVGNACGEKPGEGILLSHVQRVEPSR